MNEFVLKENSEKMGKLGTCGEVEVVILNHGRVGEIVFQQKEMRKIQESYMCTNETTTSVTRSLFRIFLLSRIKNARMDC